METLDDRERSMKLLDVMSKAILQDAQKKVTRDILCLSTALADMPRRQVNFI